MTDNPSLYDDGFLAAWETFADEVTLAFKVGASDEAERPLAAEQTRYVVASMAIAKLLKAVGQDETAGKFHLLAEAMQDVVEGLPHPLFSVERPKTAGGRRPDTSAVWRTRSSLCAGLEYLIAGGNLDQDIAINLTAKKYRTQFAKLLRPGADLKTSIRTWMKSFATDAVQNEVALSNYKLSMSGLSAAKTDFSGSAIRQAGERLIAAAAERAARLP
ncbi:hypothetical protein [Bradyrhizobium canariense]|uniref:Uncharacterized protein n=1 Tax=Bradyrhizobium canariense TaxID=255045 RepID=A0A1X3GER6_9BRAD|nr:hypothetical protein [Bradyrhizobium canariense]OSI67640.1 hypothetical protein BSZ22_24445 [Bradyrhizobium canariense]OSI77479.1 hypothetical protein BSZ23_22505 [Bradyrhizobium canariense]OSI87370.1 hypothetical protein BSZ24_27920 [Bradyrhizobium canariense]OSI88565.1 hypothetical protein BSZ25_23975 [Bradyrhizobium canariense]OSJ00958.1 hypothetical protein BSZ16_22645 [Bradyrhizobium canariense]